MVFVHPHFWRTRYLGQKKDFLVDSNGSQVELFVNNQSRGVLFPGKSNNYCVVFKDIPVEKGVIEAVATGKDGKKVSHKVTMSGDPHALTVSASSKVMFATPDNVTEFRIDVVDRNGVPVIGANNSLRFSVDGPARLTGPDLYLSDRDKMEAYEGTMYIDAPVTALIRATGKSGHVKFTVSSPGLQSAIAEIEVLPYFDQQPVSGISEPALNPEGSLKPIIMLHSTGQNHQIIPLPLHFP